MAVISQKAGALVVSSVICTGLPNGRDLNDVRKAPKYFEVDSRLSTQDRYKARHVECRQAGAMIRGVNI